MNISIITAISENNVIGNNGQLPWHLPADLKFFKKTTIGHHIIMGRKTFESIGGGRPLPERISIIVTKNKEYQKEGCITANSMEDALKKVKNDEEVFIIGGAQIYSLALNMANTMYITKVYVQAKGNVYFPDVNLENWRLVSSEKHQADEKNKYDYSFLKYQRK